VLDTSLLKDSKNAFNPSGYYSGVLGIFIATNRSVTGN